MATAPLSNLTALWNAAGTTFTAIKMNVTDTASDANSLLMNLQVGGLSRFNVNKNGQVGAVTFTAISYLAINNGNTQITIVPGANALLFQCESNFMEQRRGTNGQSFRIYNTFTDASNYERLNISWGANVVSIKPEAAGTGTVRELHISGLPTANPGAGILWNNGGTVEVGT